MKKIKIAACLMAFSFLFTGCKKEEIESSFHEKTIELNSLKKYNGTNFQPFEELDFEFYIKTDEHWLKLQRTSSLIMYPQYNNEEGTRRFNWSKNDNPDVLDDWYSTCVFFSYTNKSKIKYIVIEITQDGKRYYGWMRKSGGNLEIVISKIPNQTLAIGSRN